MTSRPYRTKHIAIRLTDAEHAALVLAAGDLTISEWARSVLLESLRQPRVDEVLVAEMWATQSLALTVLARVAANESVTFDTVRQLRESVAKDKRTRARQLLDAARPTPIDEAS